MPIELSEEDKQALRELGPNLQAIIAELDRAERAGLSVTQLRQRFQTVLNQHQGLLTHYVNTPQPRRQIQQ